jgi:DNA-binding PadR family transcriptional regulator
MTKDELIDELDLMLANGLIEIVSGFGEEAAYGITPKGREYLKYLNDEHGQ